MSDTFRCDAVLREGSREYKKLLHLCRKLVFVKKTHELVVELDHEKKAPEKTRNPLYPWVKSYIPAGRYYRIRCAPIMDHGG